MEITFPENQKDFVYRVSDPTEIEAATLTHFFFRPGNHAYVKRYPWDRVCAEQDIGLIKSNFRSALGDMIAHFSDATPTPWERALESIIARLHGTSIDWWMAGSCAMAIRGVAIVPHDIDLMFCREDLARVMSLFADCTIEPFHDSSDWVVEYFGVAYLSARIDLAFSPVASVDVPDPVDFGPHAQRNLESLTWRGVTILVPPLELQRAVNSRRGRNERVMAIDTFIDGHSG